MYPDSGDENPEVIIVTPTGNATYETDTQALTLTGTATDDDTVSSVAWAQTGAATDSGACSGTATWTCPAAGSITLGTGSNVITITATDNTSNTGYDIITVTYPIPDTTPLEGVVLNGKYN